MLTERQQQIVTGSLLGDGTIWTNFIDPLMKWQIIQSKLDHCGEDKKQYIVWYVSEFFETGCSVRSQIVKGTGMIKELSGEKEYQRYTFYTRCNRLWNDIESKWYVPRTDHPRFKRRKIVPQDLTLTPLSLCVWHMDDGSNYAKDANITLETQGFTPEEVDFLIERLDKDLAIKSKRKKTKKNQFRIYVGRKSYFDFIDMIKPHVKWDCFKYKTDTSEYTKSSGKGEDHWNCKYNKEMIREVFYMHSCGMMQKDIAATLGLSRSNVSMILSGKRRSA